MMPKLRPVERVFEEEKMDPKIERQKLIDRMRVLKTQYEAMWPQAGSRTRKAKEVRQRLHDIEDEVRASQVVILLQGDVDLKLQAEFARDHLGEWIKEMVRESIAQRSMIDRE